ncbi:probable E3 ubiquitin-protein ligase RNF144A [Telopea speciosissima]|uniref:probable E3 ubiquitin-protein ligase RNF144A n=1 Tax=Telopea speciosissima TaxID=54955 RepID=UPI001CC38351|nr:probable E3 ubiquitin-protein ligase RNF144A [Telopea speciosissima]
MASIVRFFFISFHICLLSFTIFPVVSMLCQVKEMIPVYFDFPHEWVSYDSLKDYSSIFLDRARHHLEENREITRVVSTISVGLLLVAAYVAASLKSKQKKEDPLDSPPATTFQCEICFEPRWDFESFAIIGCNHVFCCECINSYVISKLEQKITSIKCPELSCEEMLELESCHLILAPELFEKWEVALCESLIGDPHKFYCPFRDCSALLLNDELGVIRESECPICRRLFCAQCKTPWHSGIDCREFQKLKQYERGREDLMVMELAKQRKWQRCPKCRFYVEKSQGCLLIRCRCGFRFCYNCASPMKDHYCQKCKH